MPPQPQGLPRKGSQDTGPTSRTDHQCCTKFLKVVCIRSDFCQFRASNRPCAGIFPLANYNNTVRQNASRRVWQAGTTQTITTNVRRNPPRPNANQPTYWKFFRPVSFQQYDHIFSPPASRVGGGTSPPDGASAALSDLELTNNATAASKLDAPNFSEAEISFQASPHQWGCRINNSTPTLIVKSRHKAVMERITTTRLTSGRKNICPQFKIPLRIFWQSSRMPKISSRSMTKGSPISPHWGCFLPRKTSSTHRILWGGGQLRLKPPWEMLRCRRSSPNHPLNIHTR